MKKNKKSANINKFIHWVNHCPVFVSELFDIDCMNRLRGCCLIDNSINAVRRWVEQDFLHILFCNTFLDLCRAPCVSGNWSLLGWLQFIYFLLGLLGFRVLFCLSHWKYLLILVRVLSLLRFLSVVGLACLRARLIQFSSLELYVNVFFELILELFQVFVLFWLYLYPALW